jgi:hypothetical protein
MPRGHICIKKGICYDLAEIFYSESAFAKIVYCAPSDKNYKKFKNPFKIFFAVKFLFESKSAAYHKKQGNANSGKRIENCSKTEETVWNITEAIEIKV